MPTLSLLSPSSLIDKRRDVFRIETDRASDADAGQHIVLGNIVYEPLGATEHLRDFLGA